MPRLNPCFICVGWAFLSWGKRALLRVVVRGLLIAVVSLAGAQAPGPWASVGAAQPLWQLRLAGSRELRLQELQHRGSSIAAHGPHGLQASAVAAVGSVVGARGLSCSVARGIFPGQGPKPTSPPWTAGFLPTCASREFLLSSGFKPSCLLTEWRVFFMYSQCKSIPAMCFANIFSQFVAFHLLCSVFWSTDIFNFDEVQCII